MRRTAKISDDGPAARAGSGKGRYMVGLFFRRRIVSIWFTPSKRKATAHAASWVAYRGPMLYL